MRWLARSVGALVMCFAALGFSSPLVLAQEGPPEDLPVVRIEAIENPSAIVNDCVEPVEIDRHSGTVTLFRTGTEGELTVQLTVSGPVETPPIEAHFAAGSETVTFELTPALPLSSDPIQITLVEGDGYGLGEPSISSTQLIVAVPGCVPSTSSTTGTSEVPPTVTTAGVGPTSTELPRTGPLSGLAYLAAGGLVAIALGAFLVSRKIT